MVHLLWRTIDLTNHNDPIFNVNEYTYGDHGKEAEILREYLEKGDYLIFHDSRADSRRYIIGYFVVDQLVEGPEARKSKRFQNLKNPHFHYEGVPGDDVIIIGDSRKSRFLDVPLLFGAKLAKKLGFEFNFESSRTENEVISSHLRNVSGANCRLDDAQRDVILNEIELAESRGEFPIKWPEKSVESIIASKPSLLGKGLRLKDRQLGTPAGRIDLLLEGPNNELIVVEVKNEMAKKLAQILAYVNEMKNRYPGKKVSGAIVCPSYTRQLEQAAKQARIKLYTYFGKFRVK